MAPGLFLMFLTLTGGGLVEGFMAKNLATREMQTRLCIGQRRQGYGGFTRSGFADERNHLAFMYIKGDALDDGDFHTFVTGSAYPQVFNFK